jgi:hypothetical protein
MIKASFDNDFSGISMSWLLGPVSFDSCMEKPCLSWSPDGSLLAVAGVSMPGGTLLASFYDAWGKVGPIK